jgi:hypothetical protein
MQNDSIRINASDRERGAGGGGSNAGFQLLLACCAPDWDEAGRERMASLLKQPVEWEKFHEQASFHNVEPLVGSRLLEFRGGLPEEVVQKFERDASRHAQRALLLTRELLKILNALSKKSVTAIPFKGPVLAEAVYGDLALRQFSDLDILIRAEDYPGAAEAIAGLGYQPSIGLTDAIEQEWIRTGYERAFDGPLGKNLLELQWRLLPRFYAVDVRMEDFFSRAQEWRLCRERVQTLSPEDLLLALCIHAAKHCWMRLGWISDIARTLRTQAIDYAILRKRAESLGVMRIISVSLWLANRMLGCEIPRELADAIADQDTPEVGARMQGIVAQSADYPTDTPAYFRLMIALRERRRDKMKLAWRLVLTPSVGEWEAVRLPRILFPLYSIVRLMRLVGRAVRL